MQGKIELVKKDTSFVKIDLAQINTDVYGLQMMPQRIDREKKERKVEKEAMDQKLDDILQILKTIKLTE